MECMKILIEKGAEVNTKDNDDATPLHKASLLQSSGTLSIKINNNVKKM